jgi:gliding motility-associated-like protein
MRKISCLSTLVLILTGYLCHAQDFSNKGKDFWVAYGYHERMTATAPAGGSQDMVLYFAADQATNVTVSIPLLGYTATYIVPANSVVTSNPIPKDGPWDARLTLELGRPENKGIHITADRPIVAYAHIYNASVSGATILFPTPTLGKDYYSVNYTNNSNAPNAHSWFYVVATDPGITTVEITPSAATLTSPANIPFTVDLAQGQVYNVMGQYSGNTGVDLTGSRVRTINNNTGGCKRIGVFSGSGRINITCNGPSTQASSDNYMVQAFPSTAWGKKYLTAPTSGAMTNNIYRICVTDPFTIVTINGLPIGVPLLNNFFYELPATAEPMRIEATQPILVAQYVTSQGNGTGCNNPGPGDPEVIYLSPVEQNINKVLWNATNNFAIQQHFINVITPNTGTAISSFRLDGAPLPAGSFTNHPQAPGYSFAQINVFGGQHTIQSDSGFNAIAYGFGSAESYGYNAGTNIKDIYQYITLANQYATVNFPATCRNTPFFFSMTFPYQPTSIEWQFNGLFPNVTINNPTFTSTTVVNGRTLYTYTLPTPYSIPNPGTYPIRVVATNPTPDGCGGEQEIDFDIQVFEPPTANFNFTSSGCVTSPVQFTDASLGNGRPVTNWYYDFGDATNSTATNPSHNYATGGTYTVAHSIRTDVGCLSDTTRKIVTLTNTPVAGFTVSAPQYCAGSTVTFTNTSTLTGSGTITRWIWNFGEGPNVVVNAPASPDQTHTYAAPGTYRATLRVESNTGCASQEFEFNVVIGPAPVADFNLPSICMPNGAAQFNDLSTISTGTITAWSWDFGDGNTSTQQNPLHNYTGPSPFTVILTVTSNNGCTGTKTQVLNTVYAEPLPAFTFPAEVCLGSPATFGDQSTAPGNSVAQWLWDFGDGNTSTAQNPSHTYAAAGTYTVTLRVTSAAGCQTVNNTASHQVVVNPLPTVSFTTSAQACVNGPVTLTSTSVANAGAITQYTWTINGNPTGGNNASITFTPTTAGPHTVVLSVLTDKGCTAQLTSTVTINPKPVANFNLPGVCMPNGSAQFNDLSTITTGTINAWAWDFGDGNTSTQQNPLHNYTGPSPFNVTLTVTSASGCTDVKTQTLTTVYAEPQPAFAFPAEVCLGSPATFTDQSVAPNNTVAQWLWDFGDGNTSTAQNPSHTYATAGTYTVTLRVTSAAGCPTVNNIATHQVIVNPLPTASFTSSAQACANSLVTLTSTSLANVGNITQYTWTINGNPAGGNNAVITFTPTAPGPHTVVLSVLTDKGCTAQVTNTITVNPKPAANFNLPNVCLPAGTANFTSTSTISSGAITSYAWDFGDGNTSTTQNPTNTYTTTGPYNVTLTVTSDNGCVDTKTQSLTTIYAEPQAAFNAPAEVCIGAPVSFTDISTAPASSVTQWAWDFGDGNTSTIRNPSHTYATAGTYTVTLNVTSAAGCATVNNTATRTVIVNPLPTSDFNAVLPGCVTRDITFNDASVANAGTLVKWTWNFGDGPNTILTTGGSTTHAYANTGTFNVTLQVESSKGCVSTVTTKPIVINVLPDANFTTPEACVNDVAAQFTDNSTVSPGSVTSWLWNFGDANANAGNPNTSTLQNGTHHFTVAGSYTVQLIAYSNQGCTDTVTNSFFVNGGVPVAGFTVQNPNELCSNNIVSIKDGSSVDIGNLVKVEVFWDYANDPTIKLTDENPVPGKDYTHMYPEFGTPATKTVTIRYVAYSGENCLNTFTRTITLLATPTLQFSPVPAVCEDASSFQVTQAQMTNSLPGAGVFSGNGISTQGLFSPAGAGVGQHVITYTYTGTNGCQNSITGNIEVNPKPGLNAGPDKVVLEGGTVILTPSVNSGTPVTYLWSPPTGLSNPTIANPGVSITQDMTYTLTVTSDKGCTNSDQVFVKLLKSPVIPNVFTPNGDGKNDTWLIEHLNTYPGCVVEVFNRYGQIIFRSVGYNTPWNGTYNGKEAPAGTYYYIVDPKNGRQRMAGFVDIVR